VWQLDRDLADLVSAAAAVLAPGGHLLVSSGYEQWDADRLAHVVRQALPAGRAFASVPLPPPDWDFELPGEAPVLKAVLVQSG